MLNILIRIRARQHCYIPSKQAEAGHLLAVFPGAGHHQPKQCRVCQCEAHIGASCRIKSFNASARKALRLQLLIDQSLSSGRCKGSKKRILVWKMTINGRRADSNIASDFSKAHMFNVAGFQQP